MFKTLKGILFLINVFFIFGKESVIYLIYKDYSSFVERIALELSSINILCVKIFQAFALNNSLIDEKTISYFPAFVNYNRDLYNL